MSQTQSLEAVTTIRDWNGEFLQAHLTQYPWLRDWAFEYARRYQGTSKFMLSLHSQANLKGTLSDAQLLASLDNLRRALRERASTQPQQPQQSAPPAGAQTATGEIIVAYNQEVIRVRIDTAPTPERPGRHICSFYFAGKWNPFAFLNEGQVYPFGKYLHSDRIMTLVKAVQVQQG